MSTASLAVAHRLATELAKALTSAGGPAASDEEMLSALVLSEGIVRLMNRFQVESVAALERRGVFAERGYKSLAGALADLLGWECGEVRRRVVAAEQVCARSGLDGSVRPGSAGGHG